MADIKSKLGARIKELRRSKGITQEKLVEVIGSDTNNLSRIENGKKFMSADKLEKIADALNVEVKDLFDFEHKKPLKILVSEITNSLNNLSEKEVQYIYKTIENIKQLR